MFSCTPAPEFWGCFLAFSEWSSYTLNMLEASIHRRPDHVLREWKVLALRCSPYGETYTLSGLDYGDGEPLTSGVIKFFDTEKSLALDVDGVVWLLPAGEQYASDFWDRTEEMVSKICVQRKMRTLVPLTPAQERELQQLQSRK
jgi:hypothetical protein